MKKERKQNLDFSEILRPYENMWIALSKEDQSVLESSSTLSGLFKKLVNYESGQFELMKVPEFDVCYAPYFL